MANMSYCRFQNTLRDLYDCQEALDFGDAEDDQLSEDERKAKARLISLCERIADDYGNVE